MSNGWVRTLAPRSDLDIVGVVDPVAAAADALRARHGLEVPSFTGIDEALGALASDVVLDTAVPETRRAIVGAALEAGCHVLTEKPMAVSVGDAREMLDLGAASGRTHAVMQNRRYLAGVRGVRQLVTDGVIGDVGMVCADFFLGAHFGGFRDEIDNVLLLDMAIHTFDQARFMSDLDAASVWCSEFNVPGSWYRGGASALAVFEMTGGARFCYRGCWSAEGASTTWEAEWRIVGSRGTVIWSGREDDPPYAEVVASDSGFRRDCRRVEADSDWDGPAGHAGCLDEMVTALVRGEQPMTRAADNARSIAMVLAAIDSAASGGSVPLAF